jgi:hypothetical protein
MMEKGRDNFRGGQLRFSKEEIVYIRDAYAGGDRTGVELAQEFGVTHKLIYRILRNEIYKDALSRPMRLRISAERTTAVAA